MLQHSQTAVVETKVRPPHLITHIPCPIQSSLEGPSWLVCRWPLTTAIRKSGPPPPHLSLWRPSHHPDPNLEPPPTHFSRRCSSPCPRGRLRCPGSRCCWGKAALAIPRGGRPHANVAGSQSVTATGWRMGESRTEHASLGRQWAITRGESSSYWHERECVMGECKRAVGESEWISELSEHESRLLWEIWTETEYELTFCTRRFRTWRTGRADSGEGAA